MFRKLCFALFFFRFEEDKAPNVILVDFPEKATGENTVFKAVEKQNLRNIEQFKPTSQLNGSPALTQEYNTVIFASVLVPILYI